MLMEIIFKQYDVRFIAINDGVDSENGISDFYGIKFISIIFMRETPAVKSARYREQKVNESAVQYLTGICVFPKAKRN